MYFNKKSSDTMDACRFCWMCRHICPIGNATGQERNTARARALTLSLVKRDAAKLDGDIVDNLYECALCGGCTNDCATGWDPVSLTKDARLAAAINGQLPSYVEKLLDNHDKTGNIYGRTCKDSILSDIIKTLPGKADILLFLGADAVYHTPAKAIEAIDLLKKSGTVFTVFDDEPDSGYSYDFLIGSAEETRSMMAATADKLNGTGALKIICYDPADAKVFRHEYKEYGIRLNAEIITYPAFIKSLISDNILQIKKSETVFTFQDPALLARDLEDTESARYVLDACGNRREMLQCGKGTMLGGNLIMNEYLPNVMKLVADNRIANALHVSAENLVTASPAEYLLLRAAAGDKINVITLEEAVLSCL